MDPGFTTELSHPLGLQALYCTTIETEADAKLEALPYMHNRKMAKFMGTQDFMAVATAGKAIAAANISINDLQNSTGLYLCTGYIPFQQKDIDDLTENSEKDGKFSMERFSTEGTNRVNPLMTFRCLPNMPAFHISLNFQIQGPSFTTYPGTGQFYTALEQAVNDLKSDTVKYAIIGAVADQKNFLVENLFSRMNVKEQTCNSACFMLISNSQAKYSLTGLSLKYSPADLLVKLHKTQLVASTEKGDLPPEIRNLGPSATGFQLHEAIETDTSHIKLSANTFDGYQCRSEWSRL